MLAGRERVFGLATSAAEVSAAFRPGHEARFLCPSLADPGGGDGDLRRAAHAVQVLGRALAQRIGVAAWWHGYGEGPDDLWLLANARRRYPGLQAATEGASDDEAIALLALLSVGGPDVKGRVVSPRARLLYPPGTPKRPPCHLAISGTPQGLEDRLVAFARQGGKDVPYWMTDLTLGIRFTFSRGSVAFRAHHPVIQEALEDRCRKEGIDLV